MATPVDLKDYELNDIKITDESIGKGGYGKVIKLEYKGLKCVGKILHELIAEQGKETKPYKYYIEECRLLVKVRHPNIVQCLGIYHSEGKKALPFLVMEFLPTDLTSCIEKCGKLPDDISYSILHNIALGLHYLHSQTPNPIIHRDLTSSNILLASNMTAKIADLGVASMTGASKLTPVPGNACFMPPEAKGGTNLHYDTSFDIYSYGIIIIHIYSGKWPVLEECESSEKPMYYYYVWGFEDKRYEKVRQSIGSDHPVVDIIKRCIERAPQKRPKAKDLIEQTAELVSKFPICVCYPPKLQEALNEEKGKMIRESDEKLQSQKKDLEQQHEQLCAQLTSMKQPLQATIAWKQCKSPPTNVAAIQSTVICGKVYFGGGDATNNNTVYCYDPSRDDWNALPKLPVRDFGLGQINGKLVAVGGVNTKTNKCSSEIYTLADNKWESKLPGMSTARSLVAVLSLDSGLLVAGGQTERGTSTNRVELFKQKTSQWYNVPLTLPTPAYNVSLTVSGDNLYLTGGYNDQQCGLDDTRMWSTSLSKIVNEGDRSDAQWRTLHSTPTCQPILASFSDNLLALGGWGKPKAHRVQKCVYVFSPQNNCWIYIADLPEPLTWSVSATLSPTETLVIGQDKRNKENKMYKSQLDL